MKNNHFRLITFVLALAVAFCTLPANVFALEFIESEYETQAEPSLNLSAGTYDALVSAINDANTAGGAVITITSDITVTSAFPAIASEIVIKGVHTLLRDNAHKGNFFTVSAGASFTLDGGIVFDG